MRLKSRLFTRSGTMRKSLRNAVRTVKTVVHEARTFRLGDERRVAREKVSAGLPPDVRDEPHQWLGTTSSGCAATHNVLERCDFSCTACYLTKEANKTPPLPFDEVKQQLDFMRAELGPSANVQITAGEVTLLPREELARIVRYAVDIGLDPMVMTHGQTIDRDPTYLTHLMREGGLQKISFHIDTTQRGRDDIPVSATEVELHAVRDRFAEIVRWARAETGLLLNASHTITVTADNVDDLPSITRWFLRNSDAIRMLALNPTADVGRTRTAAHTQRRDEVWAQVCEGADHDLNPHTFVFGDKRCNQTCLAWVVEIDGTPHVVEVKRKDEPIDTWFFDALMAGSFVGFYVDGATPAEIAGRFVASLARTPGYLWKAPTYSIYRALLGHAVLRDAVVAIATGRKVSVRPAIFVVHNFMSSSELDTVEGKERLEACAFKLPVDGRLVSMCEMNGTDLRLELNRRTRDSVVPLRVPKRQDNLVMA